MRESDLADGRAERRGRSGRGGHRRRHRRRVGMLELELLPDGDVDVPLARNGGRGTFLLRLGGDLVGTEALLDGLVLVFDAARA